ncbi:hypothetical protein ACWD69_25940 [Micromonospora chokoriensis]
MSPPRRAILRALATVTALTLLTGATACGGDATAGGKQTTELRYQGSGGLADFVDHVVPVLRARGLFRTEYTGRTLREYYGLPRPVSAYTASTLVSA